MVHSLHFHAAGESHQMQNPEGKREVHYFIDVMPSVDSNHSLNASITVTCVGTSFNILSMSDYCEQLDVVQHDNCYITTPQVTHCKILQLIVRIQRFQHVSAN